MRMGICELCGKEADTESTSMTGCYCIDCLQLVRCECLEAIRKLQKGARKRRINKANTNKSKEQYEGALSNLMQGPKEEE